MQTLLTSPSLSASYLTPNSPGTVPTTWTPMVTGGDLVVGPGVLPPRASDMKAVGHSCIRDDGLSPTTHLLLGW